MKFRFKSGVITVSIALLTTSSAAAMDLNCDAKFAELKGQQQVITAQLKNIPKTIKITSGKNSVLESETPNRLYEQLMIEKIGTETRIKGLDARCEKLEQGGDKLGLAECLTRSAELQSVLGTLEKQLKNVPLTIKKTAPTNEMFTRLYEQVMLENIRLISQISDYEVQCQNEAKTAQQPTGVPESETVVAALRTEIAAVKNLVADLLVENKKLSKLVEKLTAQNASYIETSMASPCNGRKDALQKKSDMLKNRGYNNVHPDARNTAAQLGDIKATCESASEDTGISPCMTRLHKLQMELDKLKGLGLKEQHPDIRNIERQIENARADCGPEASGR